MHRSHVGDNRVIFADRVAALVEAASRNILKSEKYGSLHWALVGNTRLVKEGGSVFNPR